jgi:glycine C-acetyltransferase
MIGEEGAAAAFATRLIELGVYTVSFSHPVVPPGTDRIRTQMSAAHAAADLDFTVVEFVAAASAIKGG